MGTVSNLVVRVSANIRDFEKQIGSLEKSLNKTGSKMKTVGSQLTTGLTLPIVAIGGLAIKAAIDFEKSFAGVGKTVDGVMTKGGKLTAFGQTLQQGFRDMAKTMPVSVNELNAIGEAAGSLGIGQDHILGFTKVMAMLGATTNLTSEEAATGIAQIQNQYQAAGIDTDKFAASLVALGNAGASTEKQILEFAARMGGAGNQMGVSQAEVLGWSNAMASVGINAELGSTAWNKVISQMGVAADLGGEKILKFAKVAGMQGVDFAALVKSDASAALLKVVEGFGRVKAEGGNLTAVMNDLGLKNQGVQMTFKNLAGASGMVGESLKLGKQAWIDNTALTDEYGKKAATVAAQLQTLYNKAYDVAISLGQALLPALMNILPAVQSVLGVVVNMVEWFSKLPSGVQAGIIGLVGLAAALGPIIYLGGTVITTLAGISSAANFVATGGLVKMFALSGMSLVTQLGLIGVALGALVFAASKVHGAISNIMEAKAAGGWAAVLGELGRNVNDDSRSLFKSGRIDKAPARMADIVLPADPVAAAMKNLPKFNGLLGDTKGETSAAKKEAEAYRKELDKLSGREAISVANEWMKKVSAIGGITKLATNDQKSFNDALGDAIEAMGRLNQAVDPALMQAWMASFQGPVTTGGIKVTGLGPDGSQQGLPGTAMNRPVQPTVPVPNLGYSNGLSGELPGTKFAIPEIPKLSFLKDVFGGAVELASQLGRDFSNALVNSRSLPNFFANLGMNVVSTIGHGIGGKLGRMGAELGGKVGGFLGSALPMLGDAIGPLFGKLMDSLFGTKGRDAVKDFAASMGGFDALQKTLDGLGPASAQLWINLTQGVGRNNPEEAQKAIDAITQALKDRTEGLSMIMDGVNARATVYAQTLQAAADSQTASVDAMLKAKGIDPNSKQGKKLRAESDDRFKASGDQGEFDRMGALAAGGFGMQVQTSGGAFSALQMMKPALDALTLAQTTYNLTASATTQRLLDINAAVNANLPAFQALEADGQILNGMLKANWADMGLFATTSSDVAAKIGEITAGGMPMAQALGLNQPVLQSLWEAQQEFGFQTDEATQAILDQAVQQGIVGLGMKDVNQQILDVLLLIGKALGADIPQALAGLPGAAASAASGMNAAFGEVTFPDIPAGGGSYDGGAVDTGDVPAMASGGIVRARPGGMLVRVGEGGQDEAIIPLASGGSAGNGGGMTVIIEMEGQTFARLAVPYIPGEVQRLGLS